MSKLEFSRGQQSLFGEFWKWMRTIRRCLIFSGWREDMSDLINAFKLTLTKTSFSLFCKKEKTGKQKTPLHIMCKNLAERRWSPGHQRWVLASANTPVFYLQSPSSQGWLCFLGTSVNLRQKRMICPSFSENSILLLCSLDLPMAFGLACVGVCLVTQSYPPGSSVHGIAFLVSYCNSSAIPEQTLFYW